jgi:isopentenyl-diphosphate delta-isomerase
MMNPGIARKREHISAALELGDGPSSGGPGWDDVRLMHDALPDTDLETVDLGTEFLGRYISLPLVISGMTGGHPDSIPINATLARAAAATGAIIGVGSQRAALSNGDVDSYAVVREHAPDAFVLANIGIAQLVNQPGELALTTDDVWRAVDMVRADALAVHLNYLEELVQPEGQTHARGARSALARLCRELPVPVVAKETGTGLSRDVALRLRDAGVQALDVGGAGGTSFAAIESRRAAERGDLLRASTGLAFSGWGIPTAVATAVCADVLPVIATGGVRDGVDAARALALGAVAVGVGRPLLEQALLGGDAARDWILRFAYQLRAAAFLSGVATVRSLPSAGRVVVGITRQWLDDLGGAR